MHGIRLAAHSYQEVRRRLKEEDPSLDDATLSDTVEGLTDLHEILVAIVRAALDDEAIAIGLKSRVHEMQQRLLRIEERSQIRRRLARDVMVETQIGRIIASDFTVSVRPGVPSLTVIEESAIPSCFWVPAPPKLNKLKLIGELKSGATIAGAALSTPSPVLSVRTR